MKIAIIPWSDFSLADRMFDIYDKNINFDHRVEPFLRMKQWFEKNGDELHTVDLFSDLKDVDFFLFFELDLHWLDKLIHMNRENSIIYCNAEPPSVRAYNSEKGYRCLKKYFPYIMTWNDELVDNVTVFKRPIPYFFRDERGNMSYEHRKLLTCISGNKHSGHKDELYSEREKVITYFEKESPDDFDFFGGGWIKEDHPCYGGRIDVKAEVYHKYRFAIAFENIKNVKGYVTEKILDCICSGIVPIYYGADNIRDYVPEECFIPYEKFSSLSALKKFLCDMPESEYRKYLEAGEKFLKSEKVGKFDGKQYAEDVYKVIMNGEKAFHVKKRYKAALKMYLAIRKTRSSMKKMLKTMIAGR